MTVATRTKKRVNLNLAPNVTRSIQRNVQRASRPNVQRTARPNVQREELAVSDYPTIYGCTGLFDLCSDSDLMSLSFDGQQPFLDWIGWERTDICEIKKNFITWVRPSSTELGERSPGYIADPCGPSNGVSWGDCDFTLTDFSLLRRHGPVRNVTRDHVRLCETQPRYRLDGTPITRDSEFDMRLSLEAIVQDLKRMVIDGNASVSGQFDGLERLVKTGYVNSTGRRCTSMDSMVFDWNGNGMDGGAGVTFNGAAISPNYNFVDVLLAVIRRIRDRIKMAPQLSRGGLQAGDIVIVAPTNVVRCILDAYTCWSVCPGQQFNEANLNTYEARTFRNGLNGGLFGDGVITLDQLQIPLIGYDWGLVKGPTLSDVYVLTGSVSGIKTISGQYNDLAQVPVGYPDANYRATDGGRLLTWLEQDKTCAYRETEFQPRLLMWAPWAQARIQDVRCTSPMGVLSPDPWESSFYIESSFALPGS